MAPAEFELSEDEHDQLSGWSREDSRLGVRARIVLACSRPNVVYAQLARKLGVSTMTVTNVRRRFAESRAEGLADRPRLGRPKQALTLADDERAQLQRWARRPTSAQAVALWAKIVLACADGSDNKDVASRVGVRESTVAKWRARFIESRLEGLEDEAQAGPAAVGAAGSGRGGHHRDFGTDPGRCHPLVAGSMAKRTGLSKSTIGRIWRNFDLKPHRYEGFKISTDPQFVDKIVDVVGFYHNPPEKAVVLCVDELCEASHNSSDVKHSVM